MITFDIFITPIVDLIIRQFELRLPIEPLLRTLKSHTLKKKFKPKIAFSENGDVELSVLPAAQPTETTVDITPDDVQPTNRPTGKPAKPVTH